MGRRHGEDHHQGGRDRRPAPIASPIVLAPAVAATPVLAGFGVVAFGDGLSLAAIDVGVLFLLGMMGLTAYAVVLGALGLARAASR